MARDKTLDNQLAKLRERIEAEQLKYQLAVISAVEDVLAQNGITLNQLLKLNGAKGPVTKTRGRPAGKTTAKKAAPAKKTAKRAKRLTVELKKPGIKKGAVKGPRPAKYRDPETGATWSGWARPPAWIKGKDYALFLIDGASA